MKVLVLTVSYPTKERPCNGLYIRDQCVELQRQGHRVTIIHPVPLGTRRSLRLPRSLMDEGVEVRFPRYARLPGYSALEFAGPLLGLRLLPLLLRKFDLIHAHGILVTGHAAQFLSWVSGVPYVVSVHGEPPSESLTRPNVPANSKEAQSWRIL